MNYGPESLKSTESKPSEKQEVSRQRPAKKKSGSAKHASRKFRENEKAKQEALVQEVARLQDIIEMEKLQRDILLRENLEITSLRDLQREVMTTGASMIFPKPATNSLSLGFETSPDDVISLPTTYMEPF